MQELAEFQQSKQHSISWSSINHNSRELSDLFGKQIEGACVHLIPNVQFSLAKQPLSPREEERARNGYQTPVRWLVPREKRRPLAFEIQPLVDDGKHWILYTDGTSDRVQIDNDLLKQTGRTITPLISKQERKVANERKTIPYQLVALSDRPLPQTLNIQVHNHVLNETREFTWNLRATRQQLLQPRDVLMNARFTIWGPYLRHSSGTVFRNWSNKFNIGRENRRQGRSTSAFSILGGRAAVEETLQMQVLDTVERHEESANANEPIDINSIEGVKVNSHPFKEMLAGRRGGQLELAKCTPYDRFFVYLGKPATVERMLDVGAPFLASAGAAFTGNALNYGLEKRYLNRLGMTREQLNTILKSGLIRELALFCPDLFLIDGTELTVIAKVEQPVLLNGLFKLLNPAVELSDAIMEMPGADTAAFVALRGNLLFLSTNRNELKKALALHANDGKNSLGESDEFRYMLTKLGITEKTRGYAYFSDPFVRNLVGPRVKLGQLRRVLAKRQMEHLTACGMLARIDDPQSTMDVQQLKANGYLPADWSNQDFRLDETGVVHSKTYGTLSNMRTLTAAPVQTITPEEAEAYAEYLQNYSN